MKSERKTAIVTGALFIIATVASIVGNNFTGPLLSASDYLTKISVNANSILVGALLTLIAAATSAGIAIALYPVLIKYNKGLALGAVGFRLIEAVFYIVGALCKVSVLVVSQQFINAGNQNVATFQIIGKLLLATSDLAGFCFGVIAFCLGAAMYYVIMYQARLIPRWLSGWGMIALVVMLIAVFITLFDGEPYSVSGNLIYLALPIALQEMVLAVWLIVKGFNPSAIAAESDRAGVD